MSTKQRNSLREIMNLAWQFIKRNGFTMSKALKAEWANIKLKARMLEGITMFYFRKVDGSIREAYGTLNAKLMPAIGGESKRKPNDTVQVYFDTEKLEYRCFKKANLVWA